MLENFNSRSLFLYDDLVQKKKREKFKFYLVLKNNPHYIHAYTNTSEEITDPIRRSKTLIGDETTNRKEARRGATRGNKDIQRFSRSRNLSQQTGSLLSPVLFNENNSALSLRERDNPLEIHGRTPCVFPRVHRRKGNEILNSRRRGREG